MITQQLKLQLLVTIVVFLIMGSCLAAEGPNLLINSGAEYSSGYFLPDYWTYIGSQKGATYGRDLSEAHTGSASFKIATDPANLNGTIVYSENLPDTSKLMINAGTKIKIGLAYKTSGFAPGLTNKLVLKLRRHSGYSYIDIQNFYLDSDQTSWTTFETEYTIPSSLTSPVPVTVSVGIEGVVGTVWFDDVFIQIIDAEEDTTPPAAPEGVSAHRRAPTVVELKWGEPKVASDGDYPAMYKVYRSTTKGFTPDENTFLCAVRPQYQVDRIYRDFKDYHVVPGVRYYYIIAAMDNMGNQAYSTEVVANEKVAYGTNLMKNGSFENWDNPNKPTNWSINLPEYVSASTTYKFDGESALKITHTETKYTYATQLVTFEPNTDYVFVGWIKADEVRTTGNGIRFFFSPSISAPQFRYIEGTYDWQLYYHEFNSGSTPSTTVYAYLHNGIGTVYFDNVGLYKKSEFDGTPPETPGLLTADPVNGQKKVVLSWEAAPQASDGDYAAKYRIYRGDGISFSQVAEVNGAVNSWTDEGLNCDIDNFYYVVSVDKLGNVSEPSATIKVEKRAQASGRLLALVNGSYVGMANATLTLEGTEVTTTSNADGTFEFKWLLAGDYTVLARAKSYKVGEKSFSIDVGDELALGDIILEWDDILPLEPKGLTADASSHVGIIILSWEAPDPAPDGEIAEYYNIYRSKTPEIQRTAEYFLASVTDTSYRDLGTEQEYGKTFYYLVEAMDQADNPSELSSEVVSATFVTPPVPEPVSPRERDLFMDEAPVFEWQVPSDPNLSYFLIELSTDSAFSKDITRELSNESTYEWSELLKQSVWYWRVKAVYGEVESSWSEVNEFVAASSDTEALVPYINVAPGVFRGEQVIISYYLINEADVKLNVFNLGGKLVANLGSLQQPSGLHEVIWTGRNRNGGELPNGLYLIQLIVTSNDGRQEKVIKKLVIYR